MEVQSLMVSTPRAEDKAKNEFRRKVELPDGSQIIRMEDSLLIAAPSGSQMELRPLPNYDPVRDTPRSMFVSKSGGCSKLCKKKIPLFGIIRWQHQHLSLDKFVLTWSHQQATQQLKPRIPALPAPLVRAILRMYAVLLW